MSRERKTTMKFGKNLETALYNRRLTQTELAEKIGVSKMSVSRYVNGQKLPSVPKLILISKAVRVSMDTLLLGDVKRAK
jgi:transcriptional regulator with XRE-family HTH domain